MSKDFGAWFAAQGVKEQMTPDEDEQFRMECYGCGKVEYITWADYEQGDKGWYSDNPGSGKGVCGGSDRCLP